MAKIIRKNSGKLERLNLGLNFGLPSFIKIPAPMREFTGIFDIKLTFAVQDKLQKPGNNSNRFIITTGISAILKLGYKYIGGNSFK